MACDRFGFDDKKSALRLNNSLKGHALNVLKEVIKADVGKKENYNEVTAEQDNYFKPLKEGKKYGSRGFYSRVLMPGEGVVSNFDDLQKLALGICLDENNPMND